MSAAFEDMLTGCTDPDDPTYRAASLLSAAWEPALSASYELGYANGREDGYREAERDMAESWRVMSQSVRRTLTGRRHDDLRAVREARIDTPCPARCEHCSRCARAAAVAENLRRYGVPDYPDAQTRAALARGAA